MIPEHTEVRVYPETKEETEKLLKFLEENEIFHHEPQNFAGEL
jgi:hypothetical protein